MTRAHLDANGIVAVDAKRAVPEIWIPEPARGQVSGNRRAVLRALFLGALGAIVGPRAAPAVPAASPAGTGLAEMAAACVADDRLLSELGARYLVDTDGEASVPLLLARIGERWPGGQTDLARLPFQPLRRALAGIMRRDLARADIVLVDGWVLARSEARLYALAHLVQRHAAG